MTNNLERRISQHKSGYRKMVIHIQDNQSNSNGIYSASTHQKLLKLKKQIKGWSQRKKEALINENWKDLIEFSKNYTEYDHPDNR